MNVAVTAQATELNAPVETRFGRARYFLVDTETGRCTAHDNVQNVNAAQGAGIPVYVGVTGTVAQAVKAFRAGQLQLADQPSVSGHTG